MRWDRQLVDRDDAGDPALPGMPADDVVRTVRPPDFAGITFYEVRARSALNRVPAASRMPFGWTVNPYRGCTHACTYCFARNTHTYLELDPGDDFDRQIVVKTNIRAVLRRELGRPSWRREHVALGTNTDPYQRAEGRYVLMPGIIDALVDHRTPLSILTKGTLLGRDLPLLERAASRVPVAIGLSLALLDDELQQSLEPGTPSPRARLGLIRRIRAAGLPCSVLAAPLLPHLTDSQQQLDDLLGALAEAGATSVSSIGLHLRPGTRDWFLRWLAGVRPDLVPTYRSLYRCGAYLPTEYRDELAARFRRARAAAGLTSGTLEHRDPAPEHPHGPHGGAPTTQRFSILASDPSLGHAGRDGASTHRDARNRSGGRSEHSEALGRMDGEPVPLW